MNKELTIAIKKQDVNRVRQLLNAGIHINPQKTIFNFWKKLELPLNIAIQTESIEIIQLLLEYGADVNCYDYLGTPLQVACYSDSIDIVELLLEANADVNFYKNNDPPVTIACYQSKVSLLKLLLQHKADTNCLWNYTWDRFCFAIMEVLVEKCDDVPDGLIEIYNSEANQHPS